MVQSIGPGGQPLVKSQREVKTINGEVQGTAPFNLDAATRIGNTLTSVPGEGHQS